MGLTVRRIGISSAYAQVVVEYDEHASGAAPTNGSARRHQIITLTDEAMETPAPALAAGLRRSLPQLFPAYVSDDVLVPLLRQLLQGTATGGAASSAAAAHLARPSAAAAAAAAVSAASTPSFASSSSRPSSSEPSLPAAIASIGDLQRVGPAALQAAKTRMDVVFEANRVRPGEEGFVYDVRVDFPAGGEAEPNDWDDE